MRISVSQRKEDFRFRYARKKRQFSFFVVKSKIERGISLMKHNTANVAVPRKKGRVLKRIFSCWQLYLFLLIPLVYLFIFCYGPMTGLQIAFKKFRAADGIWGSPWVGFDQFTKFFQSYMFARVLRNTIIVSLYSLIAGFPMPITK